MKNNFHSDDYNNDNKYNCINNNNSNSNDNSNNYNDKNNDTINNKNNNNDIDNNNDNFCNNNDIKKESLESVIQTAAKHLSENLRTCVVVQRSLFNVLRCYGSMLG